MYVYIGVTKTLWWYLLIGDKISPLSFFGWSSHWYIDKYTVNNIVNHGHHGMIIRSFNRSMFSMYRLIWYKYSIHFHKISAEDKQIYNDSNIAFHFVLHSSIALGWSVWNNIAIISNGSYFCSKWSKWQQ